MPYVAYLVVLLVLPPLVWWRWGLLAALAATLLELALVGASFYFMSIYHLLPNLSPPEQQPPGNPMGYIRRRQADGYAQMALFAILPGQAALLGGGLAAVFSALHAIWRAARAWRNEHR